jgi:hypothetical protein
MTSRDPLIVVLLVSWSFLAFPGSANAEFLAVGGPGPVYIIDERTGNGILAGALGSSNGGGNALAIDRSGTPYTTMTYGYPLNGIYLVPLRRQDGFWLGTLGPRIGLHVPGLAFSPGGTLFAIGNNDATGDDLYTIDVDTGVRTLVGSTRLFGIAALEFSPQGILYGFDGGRGSGTGVGLVTIDPLTGVATDVDPAVDGSAWDVLTIAFAPDGTLYAARTSLFTVDITTGALTLVASGGGWNIGGMVWIPEPCTPTALLSLAAAALLVHLCRRRKTES